MRRCLNTWIGVTTALVSLFACLAPEEEEEELVAFVNLGTIATDDIAPAELDGTDTPMERELRAAHVEPSEEWSEALAFQPPEGERAFAFVLPGCDDTSAELVIEDDVVTAELIAEEPRFDCDEPNYFLAVLSIKESAVPQDATLE